MAATSRKPCRRNALETRTTPPATVPKVDPDQQEQVFKWILEGGTEHDIRNSIAEQWPDADAAPLIVAAINQIKRSAAFDAEIVLGWCFEAARDMYRRLVASGDFAGALRAVKQISDMARKHELRIPAGT